MILLAREDFGFCRQHGGEAIILYLLPTCIVDIVLAKPQNTRVRRCRPICAYSSRVYRIDRDDRICAWYQGDVLVIVIRSTSRVWASDKEGKNIIDICTYIFGIFFRCKNIAEFHRIRAWHKVELEHRTVCNRPRSSIHQGYAILAHTTCRTGISVATARIIWTCSKVHVASSDDDARIKAQFGGSLPRRGKGSYGIAAYCSSRIIEFHVRHFDTLSQEDFANK